MKVINDEALVSISSTENGNQKIVIKKGCKLGEVIDKLPNGIIHKNQTGIGATTVELNSKRNSIIVEPLKATASTKAKGRQNVLYVGSETLLHPRKATPDEIKAFLSNNAIEYKKFMVVVDSLPSVLGIIGLDNFKDYFLMIDESDSVQMDSNFRSTPMEICIRYYKLFSEVNRCLVTATPVEHNDPVLANEPITIFDYDQSVSKSINIVNTDNVFLSTLSVLEDIRSNDGAEDKVVIAFNNLNGAKELADKLVKEYNYHVEDVRILCSENNRDRVSPYFAELDSSKWPGTINFITSAYFTGFDIDERYHLIIVIDGFINCLSPNRFKQISGRCRNDEGLFSETFIHKYGFTKKSNTTAKELIKKSERGIEALDCLTRTLQLGNWQEQIDLIRVGVLKSLTDSGYKIVFEGPDKQLSISYLAIDAILELQKTVNTHYLEKNSLAKGLKSIGHNVQTTEINYDETTKKKTKEELIAEIKPLLKLAAGSIYGKIIGREYTKREDEVLHLMRTFRKEVDPTQLASKLTEAYASPNNKKINTLSQRLEFFCGKYSAGLKLALKEYLPVDAKVYDEEIPHLVNKVLEAIDPSRQRSWPKTDPEATTLFNHWVKASSATRDPTNKLYRKIKNHNPEGFQPPEKEE